MQHRIIDKFINSLLFLSSMGRKSALDRTLEDIKEGEKLDELRKMRIIISSPIKEATKNESLEPREYLRALEEKEVIVTLDDFYQNKHDYSLNNITNIIFGAKVSGVGCGYGFLVPGFIPISIEGFVNLTKEILKEGGSLDNYVTSAKYFSMIGKLGEYISNPEFDKFRVVERLPIDTAQIREIFLVNKAQGYK